MRLSDWHVMVKSNLERCYVYGDEGVGVGLTVVLEEDWTETDYATILSKMYESYGWKEQMNWPFELLTAMKNSNIMESQRKATLRRMAIKCER